MRASKHRFEVAQRPYVRLVLCYEGLVGAAAAVARGRAGKVEAAAAEEWLAKQVIPGGEYALQAALMGDAGDETLALIRFFGSEACDVTRVRNELLNYHAKLRALFCEGLALETGMTKEMIRLLTGAPKLVHLKGSVHQIGGPGFLTEAVVNRCLGRMAAWTRLGESISKGEFPGFELMQSLAPFDLEPHTKGIKLDAPFIKAALQRVCQVLQLDSGLAYKAFCDFLPIAVDRWKESQNTFESWAVALATRKRGCPDHGNTLKQLVKRVGAWGCSTSGVEQSFAKQRRTQGLHRADMTEDHVNVDAYIMSKLQGNTFKSNEEKTKFFGRVRRAWAKLYGHARARYKFCRSDKGRPNPRKAGAVGKTTETSFLKRRRASVEEGVRAAKVVRVTAPEPYWTDTHDKELDFQEQKYARGKVAAYKEGVLLACEIAEDLQHKSTIAEMNDARRYMERQKQHADHTLKRVEHTPLDFQGKTVYVDRNAAVKDNGALLLAIRKVGGKTTTNREDANVFIVDCVASPGINNQW